MSFGHLILKLSLVLSPLVCLGNPADDTWQAAREALRNRPRTVIVNNDGCDVTHFPVGSPVSIAAIEARMLDVARGCQIDTISYCPYGVGFQLTTASQVTEVFTRQVETDTVNLTGYLLEQRTDALRLAVDFARRNGFEIFASMRGNDTHEVWHPERMSDFKKQHPDWLLGSAEQPTAVPFWSAFNFTLPQVRSLFLAICTELMANYDVDGLEIDFLRFPLYFPSAAAGGTATEEERALMTALLREIRQSAEAIGKKRGRPLLIAVRVPDSIALAGAVGLDVEAWLRDGSVDLLYTGADWWRYAPLTEMIELGHRYGAKVYPSVDVAWSSGRGRFERNLTPQFAAQTAAALAAGADGVYHFNLFYAPEYFATIRRSPEALRGVDKNYFVRYAVNQDFILKDHERFNRIANLTPDSPPRLLVPGEPQEFPLEFGDDFSDPETMKFRPEAKLYLHRRSPVAVAPRAEINGTALPVGTVNGDEIVYPVPLSALQPGLCRIVLTADSALPEPQVILRGDHLLRGREQPPWRRVFPARQAEESERIVDGAYEIRDTGRAAGELANLLYPLPPVAPARLTAAFDLQVVAADQPFSAAIRIADGRSAEVIGFGGGRVTLAGAGRSVPLPSKSGFYHIEVTLEQGTLTLNVDERPVLTRVPVVAAADSRIGFVGNTESVPGMAGHSLVIGSWSAAGTGVSRWKNLTIGYPGLLLDDLLLEVRHRGIRDERLLAAAQGRFPYCERIVPVAGERFGNYAPELSTVSAGADGVCIRRLDHRNPEQPFQYYRNQVASAFAAGFRYYFAALQLRVVESAGDEAAAQWVLCFSGSAGRNWELMLRFSRDRVESTIGTAPVGAGSVHRYAVAADPVNGKALLLIDGNVAAEGRMKPCDDSPGMLFGDGSREVSGVVDWLSLELGTVADGQNSGQESD